MPLIDSTDASQSAFPSVPMIALDTVWFQVAGSVCNLACTHCFISCSPTNHTHAMMDLATVERYTAESESLGVREYYFTGGEPFLNPEIMLMLSATLRRGPTSVLTNGTLITPRRAAELQALAEGSRYSFDIRVSLDGFSPETNDAIRGRGSFARVLEAIGNLSVVSINPVITITEACDDSTNSAGRTRLLEQLRQLGLDRPRLKVMPLLRLGAEEKRTRGYGEQETLAGLELQRDELAALQCSSSRMVTASGVFVCPILIDNPAARMGGNLSDTLKPFTLSHRACYTCHAEGLNCRT